MKYLGVIFAVLLFAFKAAWSQPTCEPSSKYPDGTDCSYRGDKSIIASDGTTQYYWLDMPDGYDSDRAEQYPLIVWLHAYDEDRNDYLIDSVEFVDVARSQGWIVVAPDYRGNSWMNALARDDVSRVINSVKSEFNVDRLRVHVFGISMGGGGALTYTMYNEWVIASVAEFAGITDFTQFYSETGYESLRQSVVTAFGGTPEHVPEIYNENSALGNEESFSYTPVMLIHGNVDSVINVSHARNLYSSLLELGYDVNYFECEGIGHDKICLATIGYQSIFDFFNLHRLENIPCNGNFNCSEDQDVDGSDAFIFKIDFGRSIISHPCIAGDTCNGDFLCDGDVDGTDAFQFKSDFGRSSLQNPCPVCVSGPWCSYQ